MKYSLRGWAQTRLLGCPLPKREVAIRCRWKGLSNARRYSNHDREGGNGIEGQPDVQTYKIATGSAGSITVEYVMSCSACLLLSIV